jgi:hypothetical protein
MNTTDSRWEALKAMVAGQNYLGPDNPVIASLKGGIMTTAQGMESLRQYFYLVMEIVQYLSIAMARIPVAVAKTELLRNLGEELGSRTSGISHQELFEVLVGNELGIKVRSNWNEATQNFISGLLVAFNTKSPRYVAGMTYALEATASPELIVVAQIINLVAEREAVNLLHLTDDNGLAPSEDYQVTTLEGFLASHTLNFEVGHESGLRTTLEQFASENWEEFEDGFSHILAVMQIWWRQLARPDQP